MGLIQSSLDGWGLARRQSASPPPFPRASQPDGFSFRARVSPRPCGAIQGEKKWAGGRAGCGQGRSSQHRRPKQLSRSSGNRSRRAFAFEPGVGRKRSSRGPDPNHVGDLAIGAAWFRNSSGSLLGLDQGRLAPGCADGSLIAAMRLA